MSEWISVEDRLPDNDGKVLIGSFYEGVAEYQHVARYKKYEWAVEFGTYSLRNSASVFIHFSAFEDGEFAVTHWMPLPEPPINNKRKDDE